MIDGSEIPQRWAPRGLCHGSWRSANRGGSAEEDEQRNDLWIRCFKYLVIEDEYSACTLNAQDKTKSLLSYNPFQLELRSYMIYS